PARRTLGRRGREVVTDQRGCGDYFDCAVKGDFWSLVTNASSDESTIREVERNTNYNERYAEDVIYLTRARLMIESEMTVQHCAYSGEMHAQRACRQLIADMPRYALWHARHTGHMDTVASAKQRQRQILALRSVAVEH